MKSILKFLWGAIKAFHIVAASILLVLVFLVLANVFSPKPAITVPEGAALVLAPEGLVVERKPRPTPADMLLGSQRPKEVLLRDLLTALDRAKDDESISMLVLDLDRLVGAAPGAMHVLGNAIAAFRETDKPVIAAGQSYGQTQYYLAAQADEVWMNPAGEVSLSGYGAFPPHFASAIEKLKADVHVFRVGTYKSAVEPFIRNDMSEAAKEANRAFLGTLWQSYRDGVVQARGLPRGAIAEGIADIVARLEAAGGDSAQLALDWGLVDALMAAPDMRDALIERVGKDDKGSFKRIGYERYLAATEPEENSDRPAVAVITLRGAIVPGEAPANQIGADSAVELIGEARRDDKVKAIVLRVDSGGGSAFASELIRQALADAQDAGKPVIASFGSVAASGGYWISATADEIWALPESITGSIGIFGLFLNIDRSLDTVGINTDGVGTTPLAGAFNPTRPLPEIATRLMQTSIEDGYEKFLELVAGGRGMTVEEVDAIAQGRVWAGETARQLGLVDSLGGLDAAVARAAALAELEEGSYRVRHVEKPLTPVQRFLLGLSEQAYARGLLPAGGPDDPAHALDVLARDTLAALERLSWLKDPKGTYALCLVCDVRSGP